MAERHRRTRTDIPEDEWWTEEKELAYQTKATEKTYTAVSRKLQIGYTTLTKWKSHPYWKHRVAQDREHRQAQFEEELQKVDKEAVNALHKHVVENAMITMEYLHRRGILVKSMEGEEETLVVAGVSIRERGEMPILIPHTVTGVSDDAQKRISAI